MIGTSSLRQLPISAIENFLYNRKCIVTILVLPRPICCVLCEIPIIQSKTVAEMRAHTLGICENVAVTRASVIPVKSPQLDLSSGSQSAQHLIDADVPINSFGGKASYIFWCWGTSCNSMLWQCRIVMDGLHNSSSSRVCQTGHFRKLWIATATRYDRNFSGDQPYDLSRRVDTEFLNDGGGKWSTLVLPIHLLCCVANRQRSS